MRSIEEEKVLSIWNVKGVGGGGGRGVKVNRAKCRGTLRCKNSLCGVKVHSL